MFSRKQKTIFGLSLFIFLFSLFGPLIPRVSAGTVPSPVATSQANIANADFYFASKFEIIGTFNGKTVSFKQVGSSTRYAPESGKFCSTGNNPDGITVPSLIFNTPTGPSGPIQAKVDLDYQTNGICRDTRPDNELTVTVRPSSANGGTGTPIIPCTAGTPNCVCTNGPGGTVCTTSTTTTPGAEEPTCESTYSSHVSWLLCGLISQIDELVQGMTNIVEEQLDFQVSENLTPQVKRVWSTMRILATSIIVIVALVMVISQAVNWGPFDAYTVRKMLPKIVAAVILMQLSWVLGIWIIEFFNAAGNGIADIMYFPFGGASALSLEDQLAKLGWGAGTTFLGALLVGSIGGLIFLGPFGIILLAFTILSSILVALFVLLFRKIIIIFCMILAPIALVLWILPGTKKYWDLWWDTFIKVLMMFPLIIALIAAGRIFAFVAATGAGNAGILDLLAVLIGFFGVFFILPKTFQYGGKIFASAGNSVSGASKKLGASPTKLLGERKQQRKEFRRGEANAALRKNEYSGVGGTLNKGMHRFRTRRPALMMGAGMELERAKHQQGLDKQSLESEQLRMASGLSQQTYDAQMAGIETTEQKRLREFAEIKLESETDGMGYTARKEKYLDIAMTAVDKEGNPDGITRRVAMEKLTDTGDHGMIKQVLESSDEKLLNQFKTDNGGKLIALDPTFMNPSSGTAPYLNRRDEDMASMPYEAWQELRSRDSEYAKARLTSTMQSTSAGKLDQRLFYGAPAVPDPDPSKAKPALSPLFADITSPSYRPPRDRPDDDGETRGSGHGPTGGGDSPVGGGFTGPGPASGGTRGRTTPPTSGPSAQYSKPSPGRPGKYTPPPAPTTDSDGVATVYERPHEDHSGIEPEEFKPGGKYPPPETPDEPKT